MEACRERSIVRNNTEYEGYDGWYNNVAKPDLGAVGKNFISSIYKFYTISKYTICR